MMTACPTHIFHTTRSVFRPLGEEFLLEETEGVTTTAVASTWTSNASCDSVAVLMECSPDVATLNGSTSSIPSAAKK